MWSIPFEVVAFDNTDQFVMTHISYSADNIPINTIGGAETNYIRGRRKWTVEIEEQ